MRLSTKSNKVVLDTNIMISALIGKHGAPAKLFEKLILEEIENYTSKEIIEEIVDVLNRKEITKRTTNEARIFLLEQYLIRSKVVVPKEKNTVAVHESDNKFIDTAIEAKAKFIISGDEHLLEIKKFGEIRIMTAKEYLYI